MPINRYNKPRDKLMVLGPTFHKYVYQMIFLSFFIFNQYNQIFRSFEFRCIFKTATLVYKFLHSGHPNYFSSHLSIHCGRYGKIYNCPDKRFLEAPQFYPSVYKSKKRFGHSFAFDAPTLWNDLPDDVNSAQTLACFRKKLKSYLFDKAFTLVSKFPGVSVVSTWLCLWNFDYWIGH